MNKHTKTAVLVVALVAVLAGAGVLYGRLSADVSPQSPAKTGSSDRVPALDFAVEDAAGNTHRLSDFRGQPVVLNFWASWCPPCKAEMPDFDRVWAEMGDEVQFLMVDVVDGAQETKELGMAHIAQSGYAFPVYYDTTQEAAYLYGIRAIPTTYFIDREGNLAGGRAGIVSEAQLREGIALITE